MPSVDIIDFNNHVVGSIELSDAVFAAPVNEALLYEAVRHHLAGTRRGTASTKTRHEVAGSGRKLWKQKGTGRARMGSIRSPLWRHGGIVHGPHPHTYDLDIPRKVKKLAMRVALTQKLKAQELLVVDGLEISEPKTKQVVSLLKNLGLKGETLFVAEAANSKLRQAARNHPDVKVVGPSALSVYDVMHCRSLVMTQATANALTEIFRP